jgi:DNA-binding NtrC family response regulator
MPDSALQLHATSSTDAAVPTIVVPVGTPLSIVERELIFSTLELCGGERKRTAEMLGICTKTLYNRLREYGVRDVPVQRPMMPVEERV